MKKSKQKIGLLGVSALGFISLGSVYAAVSSVETIPVKTTGDAFTAEEFNDIVDTIRGIYNDNNDTLNNFDDDKVEFKGEIKAKKFIGDGSLLTGIQSWFKKIGNTADILFNAGNVGIGLPNGINPEERLHVAGNLKIESQTPTLKLKEETSVGSFNNWSLKVDADKFRISRENKEKFEVNKDGISTSGNLNAKTITAENFIKSDGSEVGQKFNNIFEKGGNVGIGTNDPKDLLHIKNNRIARLRLESPSAGQNASVFFVSTGVDRWELGTGIATGANFEIYNRENKKSAFVVNNKSNNVGIGTTNPSAKLDVNGIVSSRGNVGL